VKSDSSNEEVINQVKHLISLNCPTVQLQGNLSVMLCKMYNQVSSILIESMRRRYESFRLQFPVVRTSESVQYIDLVYWTLGSEKITRKIKQVEYEVRKDEHK
jgi:hypothetical protein